MNKEFVIVHQKDNIGILLKNVEKSSSISISNDNIYLLEDGLNGQRVAIKDINKDEYIFQYGVKFAIANQKIEKGMIITRDRISDIEIDLETLDLNLYGQNEDSGLVIEGFKEKFQNRKFMGYRRYNGVGTRNYYVIIPTSFCASDIATKLSRKFDTEEILKNYKNLDGIVSAAHTEGCGCGSGDIIDRLLLVIKNIIDNPNCGGALIVDLGCEKTNYSVMNRYLGNLDQYEKPIDFITIQELGGTINALETGEKIVSSSLSKVNEIKREECNISSLILGTECGASDSFSGITANPLIGAISDNIVDLNGKVLLSETPEMLGAEEILLNRMPEVKTRKKFIDGILYYKKLAERLNINMSGNLVAGNLKGGLLNLTLKSLGSIQKGGSRNIVDFVDYAQKVSQKGLNIMNGPGNDFESVTGLTASGANLILFSTGRGTTEGSLITPIIKVSSNSNTFERLSDDMDFNAGRVLEEGIEKVSEELMGYLIDVASGKIRTSSERHKKRAFQIWSAGKLSL